MHRPFKKEVPGARRCILCLHGFLGSPAQFRPFLPFFPADCSVYALLLDGHGGSTRDFARTSMEKWKRQAEDAVRHLSEQYEEIYIIAHSMGTFFAIEASLTFPKVQGIFLLATPLKIRIRPTAVYNSAKAFFGLHKADDPVGHAYMEAHSVALSKKPWEYIGWLPRCRELFRESRTMRKTIARTAVPCRIFQSERDELVAAGALRYIPQKPNITTAVLSGARHFIYTDENIRTLSAAFHDFFKGESL